MKIEELISRIALAATKVEDVGAFFDEVLKDIGKVVGLSRVTVAKLTQKPRRLTVEYQWLAKGISESREQWNSAYAFDLTSMQGSKLWTGTPVAFEDTEAIPFSHVRDLLRKIGTTSIVALPIMLSESFYGVLCFETVGTKRKWLDPDIRILSVGAQLMGQVIEREQASSASREHAKFDKLMSNMMSEFATCPSSRIDSAVKSCLGAFGKFVGIDHAFVVLVADDGKTYSVTQEWCDVNVVPNSRECQNIEFGSHPWFEDKLVGAEPVVINSREELPAEARAERERSVVEGYLSNMLCPIRGRGGRFAGLLGLHSHAREVRWSKEDVARAELVGNAIAGVLERKQSEERRNESELRFSRLAESAPDVIFRVRHKPDHSIEYISPASLAVFGYTPGEIISRQELVIEQVHPDDCQRIISMLQSTDSTSRSGSALVRFIHKNGAIIWCEIRYTDILDASGQLAASEGILRNVTERMNAEQELRQRKDAAEAATLKAQTYLDFIAHDLTNILSPVMTRAEMILVDPNASPETKGAAEKILRQTERMATFIKNTRVLAESESDQAKRSEAGDLRTVLDAEESELRRKYPKKRFRFNRTLPPDTPLKAVGKKYFSEIIEVVLDNAARYDTSDDVRVDIDVSQTGGPEGIRFWRVAFADFGPGIPDEMKKRLMVESFDPSSRFRRGIASPLCFMSLVAEHIGGRLRIQDRVAGDPAKGTRVELLLRRAE